MSGPREKFEVVIVGTGRAGSALAKAFFESKVPVALVSRTPRRGRRGSPPVFTADQEQCPRRVPFVILAVPDRIILEAARTMLDAEVIGPRSRVGHLCGALSSTILVPPILMEQVFSAHPLASLPRPLSQSGLSGITVMVEAPEPKTLRAVTRLFRRARARVAPIEREKKPLYHAGAVIGTSFTFMNSMICATLLAQCGVPDPGQAAGQLMKDVLGHMSQEGGLSGLTGPFARGDIETIASNLAALRVASQELAELYCLEGRHLARLLADSGLIGPDTCSAIQKTLA